MKDTYIKIPTEVQEKLISMRISGEATQCLHVIIRKTYGFHKKKDRISLSQFTKMTGINKPNVVRAISKLVSMCIIKKDNASVNSDSTYEIEEDTSKWVGIIKKDNTILVLSKRIMTVIKKDNEALSKKIHTIDTLTKDTITKENNVRGVKEKKEKKKETTLSFVGNSEEFRLAKYLFDKIRESNPFVKEPNFQNWAKNIDLMHRVDNIPYEHIEKMIDWCRQDDFWKGNILSTEALRRGFAKMYERILQEHNKKQKNSVYNFTDNL